MGYLQFLGGLQLLIETLGCVLLVVGFATRINAFLLFSLFVGIIFSAHWQDGFFMNWYGQLALGHEGFEYHLLVLVICIGLIIDGGGKWSVDEIFLTPKNE